MADHREPSEQPHQRPPERTGAADAPEPIDAEVVEERPAERSPAMPGEAPGGPTGQSASGQGSTGSGQPYAGEDTDAHREYQQFLEFQRFREMRRQYGDTPPVPDGAPTTKRPWYRRALRPLRFKPVRRLLYLLVLLLVLTYLYDSTFGGGGGSGSNGSSPGGTESRSAMLPHSPTAAVRTVYDELANRPESVCLLFDSGARRSFAAVHGAESCGAAALRLNERITDETTYKNPDFARDAAQRDEEHSLARISSCELEVSGGPRLGVFRLRQHSSGGWEINGYAAADCED
ncbi:hypothetical protein [Actinopolyspora xinjiangensis]|uniref:hypothetical protein n=1 Tax=Actinopolyspora xinjiangensis TaxID=405564 RepID=UPI000B830401|nr:hypothetical protein [Actinopolyspora xinjiangensis]